VRYNLLRSVEVSGQAAPGYSSGQAMKAIEEVAAEVLPREMGFVFTGLSYQEKPHPIPCPPTSWPWCSSSCCWPRSTKAGRCRGACC
jgi:hypothetical protein